MATISPFLNSFRLKTIRHLPGWSFFMNDSWWWREYYCLLYILWENNVREKVIFFNDFPGEWLSGESFVSGKKVAIISRLGEMRRSLKGILYFLYPIIIWYYPNYFSLSIQDIHYCTKTIPNLYSYAIIWKEYTEWSQDCCNVWAPACNCFYTVPHLGIREQKPILIFKNPFLHALETIRYFNPSK